jgi:hypothetical protein
MQSIQLANLDVEELRRRLRKMSDKELREFGKAARYMVSPTANIGKPPLPAFVLQLEEARAECRSRTETRKLQAGLATATPDAPESIAPLFS